MKEIRESRGLTQRDLAEMIHMDHSTVTRAEQHAPSAKLATYIKIANALNVTLVELFGDSRTAQERMLIQAFRDLPPERKDEWLQILKLARADAAAAETQSDLAERT